MVVTGTVGSGMDAIIPLFQQHAIDHFIADKTMQGVGGWLALYILVMIIQTATNYISAYGACKAELYIGRDLKRETFNHCRRCPSLISTRTALAIPTRASCPIPTALQARLHGG